MNISRRGLFKGVAGGAVAATAAGAAVVVLGNNQLVDTRPESLVAHRLDALVKLTGVEWSYENQGDLFHRDTPKAVGERYYTEEIRFNGPYKIDYMLISKDSKGDVTIETDPATGALISSSKNALPEDKDLIAKLASFLKDNQDAVEQRVGEVTPSLLAWRRGLETKNATYIHEVPNDRVLDNQLTQAMGFQAEMVVNPITQGLKVKGYDLSFYMFPKRDGRAINVGYDPDTSSWVLSQGHDIMAQALVSGKNMTFLAASKSMDEGRQAICSQSVAGVTGSCTVQEHIARLGQALTTLPQPMRELGLFERLIPGSLG